MCDKRELYTFKVIGTVPSTDLLIFKYDNIRRALMARCSKKLTKLYLSVTPAGIYRLLPKNSERLL